MMIKKSEVILLLGRKGTGKSYLAAMIARKFPRLIIFDVTNDYTGGIVVSNLDSFRQILTKKFNHREFRIILKFETVDEYKAATEDLYFFAKNLDVTVLMDEIHLFASPNSISPTLYNYFCLGRHKGLNVIAVSQRPKKVNPAVRSQADKVITFKQTDATDLKFLAEIGFNPDEVRNLYFDADHPEKNEKIELILG